MHDEFKFMIDKAGGGSAPSFLTSEIDRLLNMSVEKFISKRAFGNNPRRTTFEEDQKRRDDLRNLIVQETITASEEETEKPNTVFIDLPSDYRHAINEECILSNENRVSVKPITSDRYNKIIDDPFNKPNGDSVYRLDYSGDKFQLVFAEGVSINSYILRYLKNPNVIKETTGGSDESGDCDLATHTHREIVRMAVLEALEEIESPRYQSSKIELNEIE